MAGETVLVTGGSGYIGSRLVERHRPLVLPAPVAVVRAVDDHGSLSTICMAPL